MYLTFGPADGLWCVAGSSTFIPYREEVKMTWDAGLRSHSRMKE